MGAKCSCDPCEDRDAGLSSAAAAFLDAQPAIRPREQFEVGLCLSGGGLASAAAAVGALRALEAADLMEQFDALSVVSGSAWASAAYMFDKEPASSLLGEIAPLTALTLEALDALPPPALQGCTREAAVSKVFFGAEVPIEELRQAVAKSWLEDFSLDHLAYLAGGEEKKRRIIEAAPQLQDKDFLLPRRDRPKTWMVGAALSSEDGSVLPFAVTPSRVSAPADEDSSPRPSEAVVYPFLGGEVETFAFGGREALSIDSPPFQPGSPVIRLAAPTEPFSLSDALTMSGLSAAAQLFPGLPKPARWPVKDVTGLSSGEDVSFVSGDVADSSGLLTLLQRGIRRIVWFELGPGDGSPNARIQPHLGSVCYGTSQG
ncbi:hypothetical protein AK812_SmicGene37543 [Symbiodinium microadriaticum]|uniref:PNPLA domain-containing protein n=1 Tax=Symbiodinium microadriaticum TaxID=2951 RepID=A0A1Q9CG10_SYMMI|nr:hypothetical protein AK812_SmicGene37543 [Symbiodinium microadriaticum]